MKWKRKRQTRLIEGEDGTTYVLTDLPFGQLPHKALLLSDPAYHMLGAIIAAAGRKSHCEITDSELSQAIDRSEATVQRCFLELEAAKIIERRRRNGRRNLVLRYTLAGREARQQKPDRVINALITPDECTHPAGSMHSSPGRGSLPIGSKQEEQQQQSDVVVSSSERIQEEDSEPPGRRAFLAGMVVDLAKVLTDGKKTSAGEPLARDPADVRGSNLPDSRSVPSGTENCQDPDIR